MTKQHFQALADGLKASHPRGQDDGDTQRYAAAVSQWGRSAHAVATVCQSANPRFNRSRSLQACGLQED